MPPKTYPSPASPNAISFGLTCTVHGRERSCITAEETTDDQWPHLVERLADRKRDLRDGGVRGELVATLLVVERRTLDRAYRVRLSQYFKCIHTGIQGRPPTVDLVDNVVRHEAEGGAGVEDGGVPAALLGLAVEGPSRRLHLPEALGAVDIV